jgi:hypothetical protein
LSGADPTVSLCEFLYADAALNDSIEQIEKQIRLQCNATKSYCPCRNVHCPRGMQSGAAGKTRNHFDSMDRTSSDCWRQGRQKPTEGYRRRCGRGQASLRILLRGLPWPRWQSTGVPFAANMSAPIPSLASMEVQRYSDGQLKWIIKNGISPSGMPAGRGILDEKDMWAIVLYLRHLPPAGSLGVPHAYSAK